jgi:peptide/nickel transport system substrate-binding protein
MNRCHALVSVAALAVLIGAAPAAAEKASDNLRIVWRDALPNVDPYYNQLRVGLVVAQHYLDTLVYRDPEDFKIKPQLAKSWTLLDDRTIAFELRDDVKFHNGDRFTADDVVYTINTVISPEGKVTLPSNVNWIAKAEKIGEFSLRITYKKPFPAALEYFALVIPIWPKDYRTKVGPDGYSRAPIGTGPYKIVKINGVAEIQLERNDGYFDGPKGKPKIPKLTIRAVPDAATELTELLSGHADWIWQFSSDQFDSISRLPHLQAVRAESMRIGFLGLDAAGRSGAGNPLTKLEVRQAIFHAIDRETFTRQLVQGGARALDAPCYPTQFGCDSKAAVKYDFNPAKAKKLLATAGYPEGFRTEIVTFVLPSSWGAAVQSYLRAVGIDAKITQLQVAAAVEKNQKGEAPLYLSNWGSFSVNDVAAIFPFLYGGGADDMARDPELTKLVQEGGSTSDVQVRRKAYSAVIKRATEQAYTLPMNTYVTTYGFSKELDFKPHPDELPRFYLARWK